jgi:hypothetical protein
VVLSGIARQYTRDGVIGFAAQRCERVGAAARARRFVVPSSYVLFFVVAGGSCGGATSSSLLPRFFVVSSSSSRYVTRAHACAMRSDVTRATVTVETDEAKPKIRMALSDFLVGGSELAFTCYPLLRAPDSPFTGPHQTRGRCVVACCDVK